MDETLARLPDEARSTYKPEHKALRKRTHPGRLSGIKKRKAVQRKREDQAVTLKAHGASLTGIARALSISVSQARRDVESGLAKLSLEVPTERAVELRALEAYRLDMALLGIANRVKGGDLDAIDRWTRLIALRMHLLGLASPRQTMQQTTNNAIVVIESTIPGFRPQDVARADAALLALEHDEATRMDAARNVTPLMDAGKDGETPDLATVLQGFAIPAIPATSGEQPDAGTR